MIYSFSKSFSKVFLFLLCAMFELQISDDKRAIAQENSWQSGMNFSELIAAMPILPPAKNPELTKPDPLDLMQYPPDPLIPFQIPFTPLQRRKLTESLDKLNLEAQVQAEAGNYEAAFEIWYRELRGRRSLGTLGEIDALGRVGKLAWEKNRKEDLAVIHRRLALIKQEQEKNGPLTSEILTAFARAYQQTRSLDDSIKIYQQIRNTARQQNNLKAEKQALRILGELYLAKFDYSNGAEVYEILLTQAQGEQNAYDEGIYLQKLAEIYSKSLLPENAVKIKEKLVNRYFQDKKIELVSDLKIAIGDDYDTLKQPEKASQNYQEAFSLSWSLQQYGASSLALKKLANLYKINNQPSYSLQIYQKLLKVEQQSYNYYGLMKTYEAIGQIYQEAKQYQPALTAYQQALTLARSLRYQDGEDYFLNQIQTINKESSGTNPAIILTPKL